MPVLELSDISKKFGATVALDGVNLALERGQVHALIGENGAGKTTLLNILAGAIKPDRGQMSVNGNSYRPLSSLDARQHGIALIHQELSLFPHLSVAENIFMGLEPRQLVVLKRRRLNGQARTVLEDFGHTDIAPETRVSQLPIAARQIVEICRALASEASIILMDEPTSSLQRADVERLFALIQRLSQRGVSFIYISHFLEEVREVAERFTVLRDGQAVASGELQTIADTELLTAMVGRAVENLFPERNHTLTTSAPILEVRDLFAPPAVKQASFKLHRGEIVGIAGLMGSGRTEMVRAIFGLDKASSGTISVQENKSPLSALSTSRLLRSGIGYLSEDRGGEGLARSLSIADNITLSRFSNCATRWGWLDLDCQETKASNWIDRLGIKAGNARQPVNSLSGGNQQKVAFSRLLHQDADVLLLDEPTRGIDIGSKAQIYRIIADCAAQNKGVLMISSYLPELFGMCDRLAVMSRGHLSVARPIAEWNPEQVLQMAIGNAAETSLSESLN